MAGKRLETEILRTVFETSGTYKRQKVKGETAQLHKETLREIRQNIFPLADITLAKAVRNSQNEHKLMKWVVAKYGNAPELGIQGTDQYDYNKEPYRQLRRDELVWNIINRKGVNYASKVGIAVLGEWMTFDSLMLFNHLADTKQFKTIKLLASGHARSVSESLPLEDAKIKKLLEVDMDPETPGWFTDALIVPGYKYLGPGNSMSKGVGVNAIDEAARLHDIAYSQAEYEGDVTDADEAFIAAVEQHWGKAKMGAFIGKWGITAKMMLENYIGKVYPHKKTLKPGRRPLDTVIDHEVEVLVDSINTDTQVSIFIKWVKLKNQLLVNKSIQTVTKIFGY